MAESRSPGRRLPRTAIGTALIGALVAVIGYGWVSGVSIADYSAFGPSVWYRHVFGISSGPCIAVFLVGAALLIGSLVIMRISARPSLGAHFIWVSVGLGGVAVSLSFVALSVTNSLDNSGELLDFYDSDVWGLAILVFIAGIAIFAGRAVDRRIERRG